MWNRFRLLLLTGVLLASAACASTGTTPGAAGRPDLLMEDQIRHQSFSTAYDAVLALRPTWLRTRGVDSFRNPGQIQVYLDNMRMGGVQSLTQIPAVTVSYIRWYDGVDAAGRWGLDHGNGVIFVSTTPLR
jgi:hypothetical protein